MVLELKEDLNIYFVKIKKKMNREEGRKGGEGGGGGDRQATGESHLDIIVC